MPHCGFDLYFTNASQVVRVVKNPPANAGGAGDVGFIPGLGKSPGGGNGNHCSILAWKIPWTKKPHGLKSMALQKLGHY